MEFIPGKIYTLSVVGIREENESKYIYLSDGVLETYRVRPYDFQVEWEDFVLPDKMNVFVTSLNVMNGLPYLVQVRKEVLEHCFTAVGEEYPFKVMGIEKDDKTGTLYYDLKDDFGIRHRYYPKAGDPKREINDLFSLQVVSIDSKGENHAFLRFDYLDEKGEVLVPISDQDQALETIKESKFGKEDSNTEFKSTIVFPAGGVLPDIDKQMQYILKIIAGFQNSEGGKLYIGVNDSGKVCGINQDYAYLNTSAKDPFNNYQCNTDGYENKIRSAVSYALGKLSNSSISFDFNCEDGLDYCIIAVKRVLKPVFVDGSKLFQRTGNMTQILKGDEITWFVEDRMMERNRFQNQSFLLAKQDNAQQINEQEAVSVVRDFEPKVAPVLTPPKTKVETPPDDVWHYITLYKNGDWSFQKKALNSEDAVFELPIMKSLIKERLLMVYANGCVNMVTPFDIIYPKGVKGRSKKTPGRRYMNGWNTNSEILTIHGAGENDLIVIQSKNQQGDQFIKIHNVAAISNHTSLHLAGNIVVNPKFGATITGTHILPFDYKNSLSSLIFKNYQTSTEIGFNENDRNIQTNLNALRRIISNQKETI